MCFIARIEKQDYDLDVELSLLYNAEVCNFYLFDNPGLHDLS